MSASASTKKKDAKGTIRLPTSEYLAMLDGASASSQQPTIGPPPVSSLLSAVAVKGRAVPGGVETQVTAVVDVLTSEDYVRVPLVAADNTLVDWDITYSASLFAGDPGSSSDLGDDDDLAAAAAGAGAGAGAGGSSSGLTGGALIGLSDSARYYTFVARPYASGRYSLRLSLRVPYANMHNSSFSLKLPLATRGEVEFAVPRTDVILSCETALLSSSRRTDSDTIISASLPPLGLSAGRALTIHWQVEEKKRVAKPKPKPKPAAAAAAKPAPLSVDVAAPSAARAAVAQEEPIVVSTQALSLTLGEGLLGIAGSITYSLVNTSRDTFDIKIPDTVRVLDVSDATPGAPIIKTWTVLSVEEALASGPSASGVSGASIGVSLERLVGTGTGALSARVLRIKTSYPQEGRFTANLLAEVDLGATSTTLRVPAMRAVGVTREKGYIGAGPKTNVEVEEVSALGTGFSRIDVRELPSSVSSINSTRHVLAYKFLHSGYKLQLRVTKHADVAVLVAAIDAGLVSAIVTPEGKHLVRVQLNVRNTERQFLRVQLPDGAIVWTTSVWGTPTKPALDTASGDLLIPLPKASDGAFPVSFVYVVEEPRMTGGTGVAVVQVPILDLAVSHLFVAVKFMQGDLFKLTAAEGGGGMRARSSWSVSPPTFASAAPSSSLSRPVRQQNRNRNRAPRRRTSIAYLESESMSDDSSMCSSEEDDWDEEGSSDDAKPVAPVSGRGAGGAGITAVGVIPIDVCLPEGSSSTVEFKYERLLLGASEVVPGPRIDWKWVGP